MYDEYERAVGAQSGSRVSILGWLGIAAVLVSLVGATGAFFAYRFVKGQVNEIAEQFRPLEALVTMGDSPMVGAVVAQTLAAAGASERLEAGEVQEAITRALDLSSRTSRTSRTMSRESRASSSGSQAPGESMEGQFRIRTGRGDFTANLDADGERGRFVVRRPDGEVIVDLAGDEDGGRFMFRADGQEAWIEAGDRAEASQPRWISELGGAPESARSVLSGQLAGAEFGAVTWTSGDDPKELVERLRQRLSDEGWQFEADHDLRDGGSASASTIARLPEAGRTVVFAAGTEDGRTTVVQGWAERRPEG